MSPSQVVSQTNAGLRLFGNSDDASLYQAIRLCLTPGEQVLLGNIFNNEDPEAAEMLMALVGSELYEHLARLVPALHLSDRLILFAAGRKLILANWERRIQIKDIRMHPLFRLQEWWKK